MTVQTMIELVKQHHPDVNEKIIVLWLNQAQREIMDKIGPITTSEGTFNTNGTSKYYDFTSISGVSDAKDVLKIKRVDFDGERIPEVSSADVIKGY